MIIAVYVATGLMIAFILWADNADQMGWQQIAACIVSCVLAWPFIVLLKSKG